MVVTRAGEGTDFRGGSVGQLDGAADDPQSTAVVITSEDQCRGVAQAAGSPDSRFTEPVHITAVTLVPDRRIRDEGNWYLTAKAVIDGITDRKV